jgi:colicin import membrane protein
MAMMTAALNIQDSHEDRDAHVQSQSAPKARIAKSMRAWSDNARAATKPEAKAEAEAEAEAKVRAEAAAKAKVKVDVKALGHAKAKAEAEAKQQARSTQGRTMSTPSRFQATRSPILEYNRIE